MKTKYSEEYIQKALNYLKIRHPERATREGAIKLLDGMKVAAKDLAKALENLSTKSDGTRN